MAYARNRRTVGLFTARTPIPAAARSATDRAPPERRLLARLATTTPLIDGHVAEQLLDVSTAGGFLAGSTGHVSAHRYVLYSQPSLTGS